MEMVVADSPTADEIRARFERLSASLRNVAAANGHDPDRLQIVAVTKTHPIALVRAALEAGLIRLGESRVQEAEPKVAAAPEAEWHFIGRLQSNKARRAVRAFTVIHSVDSLDLLRRVQRIGEEVGRPPRLLLEVNLAGQSAGFEPIALAGVELVDAVRQGGILGLMTIARAGSEEAEARATFGRLRDLRDRLQDAAGTPLPELSMGMSADALAAAAEGATLVRIGTALFGPRT